MLELVAYAAVGAIGNRYAGMAKGNRYTPALFFAALLFLLHGPIGLLPALGFLAWRAVGWSNSIDMGRNDGSVAEDFATMWAISLIPALALYVVSESLWLAITVPLAIAASYAAAMWLVPWQAKFQHIAIAEVLAGAVLGAAAYYALTVAY